QDRKRISIITGPAGHRGFERRAAGRLPAVPFGPVMVDPDRSHLVERDDQKKLPEFFSFRDLVFTGRGPPKKCSKYRLDNIFGVEPRFKVGPDLGGSQGV